ncbi:hypothetical protein Dimus_018893 [Dionaea muscipula]
MARESPRDRSHNDGRKGEWILVLRRNRHSSTRKGQGCNEGLFTVFVDDLPNVLSPGDLHRNFTKFGVVRDVFIPRKRSIAGRRFGFVRYDCSVAAEVAVKKNNGIWIHDKELKVKAADYARIHDRKVTNKESTVGNHAGQGHQSHRLVVKQEYRRSSHDQLRRNTRPFVEVVMRGKGMTTELPSGKIRENRVPWSRAPRSSKDPTDSWVRMGRDSKTYSRNFGRLARRGMEQDRPQAKLGMSGMKQVWVPVNKGQLSRNQIRPQTRRANIGSEVHELLPTEMKLLVGTRSYGIRIAEEQAVFIYNSDFRCGCACHGPEDEQAQPLLSNVDDDDDDGSESGDVCSSGDDEFNSVSFIAETQEARDDNREGGEPPQESGGAQTREIVLFQDKEVGVGPLLVDEYHSTIADLEMRMADGCRETLDQEQIQNGSHDSGLALYRQDAGPDVVRPTRFQAGPFFNPN